MQEYYLIIPTRKDDLSGIVLLMFTVEKKSFEDIRNQLRQFILEHYGDSLDNGVPTMQDMVCLMENPEFIQRIYETFPDIVDIKYQFLPDICICHEDDYISPEDISAQDLQNN